MSIVASVAGISKAYGQRPLFSGVSLELRAGLRLGMIGPNGAGKSTLLKILAGIEVADEGDRSQRRGSRLIYLPQDDRFDAGLSVADVIRQALADEPIDDHERDTRSAIILTQFNFPDPDQQAAQLSGGWRKRLSLAAAIVRKPDFLLLDEPTNHLDLTGVVWLERLLRGSSFGYLVITHDRAFLRAVADEIIEVNRVFPDGLFRVPGSYDDFADRRDDFLEAQSKQMQAVANQVRRETEWLGHKARARTRKASSRIEAAAQRRDQLAELKYRDAAASTAGIDFVSTGRQTRKLLTATGISKSLGRPLFTGIDLLLSPGAKIGLLGPNGGGRSTLLKLLAGQLEPDAGSIVRAEGLRTVMFEQGRATLDQDATLQYSLCPNGEMVQYRDRPMHVAAWAKQFLFRTEQLGGRIRDLSGGEQARVRIAQLMLRSADLLLLDEPTNDLDIPSLEVLEDSLADFPGAMVLVSHDRELIDRLCTEIIGLDGQGNAGLYGSVDQWLNSLKQAENAAKESRSPKAEPARASKKSKLSYREKQELEGMEKAILLAETTVREREAAVEQASVGGHLVLLDACKDLEIAQKALETLYARWQELEAKQGE